MERERLNETKEYAWNPYFFHHKRPLEYSNFQSVAQLQGIDEDFEIAYEWVERKVGFYPLFLAVGNTPESIQMTGYQNQWQKLLGFDGSKKIYRGKGEQDNFVLFSFKDLPDGIFMDFHDWHLVLNSRKAGNEVTSQDEISIFKPSYTKSDWMRYAKKNPHSVQFIMPELDLAKADLVSVRNKETQKQLQDKGFGNVEVRRIPVI